MLRHFLRETTWRFFTLVASLYTTSLPKWALLRQERICNPRKTNSLLTRQPKDFDTVPPLESVSVSLNSLTHRKLGFKSTLSSDWPIGFSCTSMVNSWTLLRSHKVTADYRIRNQRKKSSGIQGLKGTCNISQIMRHFSKGDKVSCLHLCFPVYHAPSEMGFKSTWKNL